MAIDPNLVSIIPASELPSKATPDATDEFLIYDGTDLKKSTWSNVSDYLASGVNGEALTTTDPPETGFYRYIVHEAGTYTNFGSIEVTTADLDGNLVFLEVTDNVAKKVVIAIVNPHDNGMEEKFSFAPYPVMEEINLAINDIILEGDFDPAKIYSIKAIYKADPTNKYRIIIQEVDASGVQIAVVYDTYTSFDFTPTSGVNVVNFPTLNNRKVTAWIDYSKLSSSANVTDSLNRNNYTIKPNRINDKRDVITNALRVDNTVFTRRDIVGSGISPNSKLVHSAIKAIQLLGDWDRTKNYAVTYLSRNGATDKYRIIIQEVDNNGGIIATVYDSYYQVITESAAGTVTKVEFPRKYTNEKLYQVIAWIDYGMLTNGASYNVSSLNGYFIKPENISKDFIGSPQTKVFVDNTLGLARNENTELFLKMFKNIQLLGDWDAKKRYMITYLSRNISGKYRIIIQEVDTTGSVVASVYDRNIDFTENPSGTVSVIDFGFYKNKQVIAWIDWSYLTVGGSVNFATSNKSNFSLDPNTISLNTVEYLKQSMLNINNIVGSKSIPIRLNDVSKRINQNALNSKKGFLTLRVDDNHFDEDFISIWEKYGFRYSHAINAAAVNYAGQWDKFRELQSRGHEICDHTPNHSCNYFDLPNEYVALFTPYIGNGIDSIVDYLGSKRVYLSRIHDANYSAYQIGTSGGYSLTAGSSVVTGDFSLLVSAGVQFAYLYIDNASGAKIGWIPTKIGTATNTSVKMALGDSITELNATATENISMYMTTESPTLGDNATYLLMLAGQCWCNFYGLRPFRTWVQPGGNHAMVTASSAQKALEKLGMAWAEAGRIYTGENSPNLTFCQNREFKRTNSDWDTFLHFDTLTQAKVPDVKRIIAKNIATRHLVAIAGHNRFSSFEGADDVAKRNTMLSVTDTIASFLHKNNIEILNFEEREAVMNAQITYRGANVFPRLQDDLNADGLPDAYNINANASLDNADGNAASNNISIKKTDTGDLFDVKLIGGVEKGENIISYWVKGNANVSVIVKDSINDTTIANNTANSNSASWTKKQFTFEVPYDVDYLDVYFTKDGTTEIKISDVRLSGV